MKALLIRCYPAVWRERYGDEFASILDERPLGPFDVADILLGALDARLRMRGRRAGLTERKGFNMSLRIGGIAAITGGLLWAFGSLVATEWVVQLGKLAPAILLLVGTAMMFLALAGMSAFQARRHPVLAWAAFVVPAIGMTLIVVAFSEVLGENSWTVFGVGVITTWVGFILFATVTYLTGLLSRRAAALVGFGITFPVAIFFVAEASGNQLGGTVGNVLAIVAVGCAFLGWFALGADAIRLDRQSSEPRPA
jgi:energy-converting hydrogenase Eha subunit E